jgi:DNA-binding NarL/FixJ family response regulator
MQIGLDVLASSAFVETTVAKENQLQIILIDRSRFLRDCLTYCLNAAGFQAICFDNGEDVPIERVIPFSIVILHSDEPMDRLSAEIDALSGKFDNLPLLILSSKDDLERIVTLIQRGIRGYIPFSSSIADVLGAIRLVQSGSTYFPATSILSSKILQRKSEVSWEGKLTPKETAIISRVSQGKPNKVIAYELCMCESTVKVHIRNMMRKMKVRNRTELVYKMNGQNS